MNDKKIADNDDNFTIILDADKFYSIVILYGYVNISSNSYLNLNIIGPYHNQSDLFYNQTINTTNYYDNTNINDTLTSLTNDVSALVKANDISNYMLYKQQNDYINTIIDIKSINNKYISSKSKTNLNILNYKHNYANINNIKYLSNILLITLIIIICIIIFTLLYNFKDNLKIIILTENYEFSTKISILCGLLILLVVIIIILNYYKNNLSEKFENPITNISIVDYLNNINQLLYQINKQMVNLSVFDTSDLTYLNANIKALTNAKKEEKIAVNMKINNNTINIDYYKYIYFDIFCCILTILLIISIITYIIFPDYYQIICIITIIVLFIIIYIFNYYTKQITNLDYNKKYLDVKK